VKVAVALVAVLALTSCARQATAPSAPERLRATAATASATVEPAGGPLVVDLGIGRRTVDTVDGSLRVTPLDGGVGLLTRWHDVVEHEIVGDSYPGISARYRCELVRSELYDDYPVFWRQDRDGLYRYPVVILGPVPPAALARARAALDSRHAASFEAGLRRLSPGAPREGEVLVLRYPLRPGTSFATEAANVATVEGFGWRTSPAGRFRVAHVRLRWAGGSAVVDYGAPGRFEDDLAETVVDGNVRIEFRETHVLTAYVPGAPE
jgi:hypothetical protein